MDKKDENKNTFITSHNQSGGITAHTVNIGPQTRVIDQNIKSQLLQLLTIYKKNRLDVNCTMGDSEAYNFALQIKNYLVEQGYSINGVNQCVYVPPISGQNFDPDKLRIDIGSK